MVEFVAVLDGLEVFEGFEEADEEVVLPPLCETIKLCPI